MIESSRILKKSILGEDINSDIIMVLDQSNLLYQKLKENYKNSNLSKNNLFRGLNSLSESDSSKALDIINLIGDKYNDISYLAIKIKVLSAENFINEAITLIEKIPSKKRKKRLYMPIYQSLCLNNKNEAFNFLKEKIYKKYRLFESDLECLYDHIDNKNLDTIIQIMSDNDIIIEKYGNLEKKIKSISKNTKIIELGSNFKCKNCNNSIIKIPFDNFSRKQLISNLEKVYLNEKNIIMDGIKRIIKSKNYNAFIDGNNVLFYIDRSITVNSFIRLQSIFYEISKTHKPLITLHVRHKDFLKKNLKGEELKKAEKILESLKKHIFYTPYKMNDDWFFIWAGINTNNSLIITNDLLRDHINKISEENIISNTLYRWITDYIVRYDFINSNPNNPILTFPNKISIKIQKNNNIWHIPTSNKKWICVEVN